MTAPGESSLFADVLAARLSRRAVLSGGLAAAAAAFLRVPGRADAPLLGFRSIPPSSADAVIVPTGYRAEVLFAWGDPVSDGPPLKRDASNTAAEQARQAGMHHDGMQYFPLDGSRRGLLALNHEYTDEGLLHPGGPEPWTPEKMARSQAAHGVSVIEVARDGARWSVVRPSRHARRITARTPMRVDGPAAGHPRLRTSADPTGRRVLGTLSNCAHGATPWGTYLTCEENFNAYFASPSGALTASQRRYGLSKRGFGYRWHELDPRFDMDREPNEPNRFGWVVEIDPYDPAAEPVKHTALGRFKHEGATVTLGRDGRVVVYMGDDEAFEYVYKFVSRERFQPGDRAAARRLLADGDLYVARFDAGGTGVWLPLRHGHGGLDASAGFADQGDVVIDARAAADRVGGTRMDRPEWIAVHPVTGEAYVALTGARERGEQNRPGPDAANPRAANAFGHIVRWREDGGDAAATRFSWDVFLLCGDPEHADDARRGTIRGDAFASPDGLAFDARGVLWIRTDVSARGLNRGDFARLGNNQMLAADPATGEVRRFMTGPNGCEVAGVAFTPDGRTMFVNIQHPGEIPGGRSDPRRPMAGSTWPDGPEGGRPRSATVVVTREDGGAIGT